MNWFVQYDYSFSNCLHFQNFKIFQNLFFKIFTNCKMPHISSKMTHCIQNITNTFQKQTFANTFGIILIPVRFLCVRELCVVFCKKCFMKLKTELKAENWELVYGFADLVCGSGVWVSGFRNCVTSKDFVCKQLKKEEEILVILKQFVFLEKKKT